VGFEPTISTGERPQTYTLDRAATGTGHLSIIVDVNAWSSTLKAEGRVKNFVEPKRYTNMSVGVDCTKVSQS